ncbi:glycosyl hydrolase family 76-domain-containing protein [Lophiotrema nucula]|uniref:Glycosyl hydrolase family 76-domain-containing protein n=1 Tax=Lophiotrema nucula TaxID=690887 RepID=A0A6A5ZUW9_9PLEO|nr:glycosyl hydrolase family 76-domain-containing protein [Lophiotrema nucula]
MFRHIATFIVTSLFVPHVHPSEYPRVETLQIPILVEQGRPETPGPQGLGGLGLLAANVTNPTTRAELALSALQIWYNAGTGLWNTAGWWNSANVLTMIGNLAKYDSSANVQNLAKKVFANSIMQAPAMNPQPGVEDQSSKTKRGNITFELAGSGYNKSIDANGEYITTYPEDWGRNNQAYVDINTLPISKAGDQVTTANVPDPDDWLDGFYDDDLWWALGWIGAYDVTKNIQYLQLAEGIFMAVTKAWPTNCGNGGIWWSWRKDYMNAIANELFLSTAAHLANRAENKGFYVDWAKRELDWFLGSGMINSRGTINDGLTANCKNNNRTTWSYNQGVILGGLVELNKASPNGTYLTLAAKIAKAAIKELSDDNGIIHDECGPLCGPDASQFKGIFVRNLQLLHAAAPDDAYVDSIQANADSIWENNRDVGNMLSINWAGPYIAPANATTHSSAMDALVAAITVK